ncbi:hypothetical protein HmCmsJML079_02206 [Escherichia coli]|nr:hypothetical protein HmCmsJML079_02206 [Escherichia coli]
MLRTCRPGIHFRGISRFVYLTAMTKAGSNVGFLRPYIPLIRNCVSVNRPPYVAIRQELVI